MKTIITATCLLVGLSLPVFADDHMGMSDDMHSGHMMQMQDNMQKMQALMADIHQEKNPAKIDKMMQEHMSMMQDSMKMMDGGMGMGSGTGMGMKHGMGTMSDSDTKQMDPSVCGDKRHGHIEMMHEMMQQMMDHMQMMEKH